MANFKIEIPDEKLNFILELFNQFSFIKYQAESSKPGASQVKKKFVEAETKLTEEKYAGKMNEIETLRNAIEKIQSRRSGIEADPSLTLFRFPHVTEDRAINISTYDRLISTIENYYRIDVTKLKFIANRDGYEMDRFIVMISLPDNTELKAGYCNKNLEQD